MMIIIIKSPCVVGRVVSGDTHNRRGETSSWGFGWSQQSLLAPLGLTNSLLTRLPTWHRLQGHVEVLHLFLIFLMTFLKIVKNVNYFYLLNNGLLPSHETPTPCFFFFFNNWRYLSTLMLGLILSSEFES